MTIFNRWAQQPLYKVSKKFLFEVVIEKHKRRLLKIDFGKIFFKNNVI